MKLQVLLSVMNQTDHSILGSINLQTSAVVVNQSDEFKYEEIEYRGSDVLFITLPERGVGLSRNTALMRADADIVITADDDVQYVDGYEQKIIDEFKKNPEADMIVFNVLSDNPDRPSYEIKKPGRVRKYNSLRYGTYRMAFRTDSIRREDIYFSLLFGGGAKYSSGEDSLFIYTAIKRGLKVYKSTERIGSVAQSESTWFEGYTDKFFRDKGALFRALSPRFYVLLILQFVLRKKRSMGDGRSVVAILRLMHEGAKEFKPKVDLVEAHR